MGPLIKAVMHTINQNSMDDTSRLKTKTTLLISSVVFGLLGIALFIPLLMSVMAFDAPGSEQQVATWIVFLCLFTFSPICILSIVCSWILYGFEKYRFAKIISLSPLVNVSILFALFSVSYVIDTPSRLAKSKIERQKSNQMESRLNDLCKDNLVTIYKRVNDAKSLYLSNCKMDEAWWLWKENLDFVETRHFDKNHIPVYSRNVRDLIPPKKGAGRYPIIRTEVDKPEAHYELNCIDITNDDDKKIGIQVKEYSVVDRQNGELLAHYKIVKSPERTCPSVDPYGNRLLSYVLGNIKSNKLEGFGEKLSSH